ncbi:SpaA isopeptide-forming pilin-related protein [Faecalispora jeddahensis]|uniref:SpaA isopeptide-forming pilin-related protein n=1 Tax=Faecalispora jeddahensis TaxID=1414721 RepID=UPI001898A7D3|nr:SpaA isopeptide-forming pilin-related protein [Faecalispora jeddahensis]
MKKWMGKRAVAVILCLLVALQALPFVAKADGGADAGKTTIDLLKDMADVAEPEEVFSQLGLSASIEEDLFKLTFDFSLDNTQIQDKLREAVVAAEKADDPSWDENKADGIVSGLLAEDPTTALDPKYEAQLSATGFTFTLNLEDKAFQLPDGLLGTDKPLAIEDTSNPLYGQTVGTYSITQDAGDPNVLTVTATLDPRVYKWSDVSATASIGLTITKTGEGTKDPVIEENGDKIDVEVTFSGGGTSGGGEGDKYTIAKKVADGDVDNEGNIVISKTDSEHFLTYIITAKAPKDKVLDGMTIKDPIPEGLTVAKVEFGTGADQTELGDTQYSIADGTLIYAIPDTDPDTTEVVLTVTTMLTLENYEKYIIDGSPTLTFTNQAKLYGSDPNKEEALSDSVTSKLTEEFMDKQGERVGLNSPEWKWTITANTYFTGTGGTVYLIDSIQGINQTHMYKLNGNELDFTVNDDDRTAVAADPAPNPKMTYKKISEAAGDQTTLTSTLQFLSDLTASGANAVYYVNGDEAVLIIPLAESELNQPLKVTYSTEAIASADGTYTDKDLKNEATMLWEGVKYDPGTGSGGTGGPGTELPSFSFNIKKEYTMDYAVLKKDAGDGSYNKDTREMTWTMKVNYSHLEIDNAQITDVLHDDVQVFKSLSAVLKETGKSDEAVTITKDGTSPPSYILTPDPATHTTLLTISLGRIEKDQVYEITLKTTVVDPSILNQNSDNAGKLTNTATITGDGLDAGKDYSSTAEKKVGNTILEKDNIGLKANGDYTDESTNYYDFANHQLYWRVTINPNHASIAAGAVLTDTVPTNTEFGKLLEVKRISESGSPETKSVDLASGDVEFSGTNSQKITLAAEKSNESKRGVATFTFQNTFTDTYELVFTTTVKEAYRKEIAKALNAYSFKNDSTLTGKVVDPTDFTGESDVSIAVSDDATHTVRVPSIGKQGQYKYGDYSDYGSVYRVDWQILLNADGVDMAGATLTDNLKAWFQLDQASLSIKAVDPDSISSLKPITGPTPPMKNYITTTGDLKSHFEDLKVSDAGFSFKIPAGTYASTPLLITFTTLVIGEITSTSQMSNSVTLAWSEGGSTGTGDQQANNAQTLTLNQVVTAGTRAQLRVLKTSTNTTIGPDNLPAFRLPGAQFALTQMKWDGSAWVSDGDALTKTTSSSGMIYFLYLKKDTLYQLKETAAPAGYQMDSTVYYYGFPSDFNSDLPANYPAGTIKITDYTKSFVIENEPKNASGNTYSFSFTKQSDDGNPISGATFTLTGTNLQTKTETSNVQGAVKFENIDPGTYTLKETAAPNGFQSLVGTVSITINVDGQLTVQPNDGFLQYSPDPGYTVTNTRIRGTVTLQKQDSADSTPVSGAKFTVYSKSGDVAVAYLTESDVTSGLYQLSALEVPAKNAAGDWYLSADNQLIVGDYYLKETTTPAGYLPDTDEQKKLHSYDFSITSQGQTVTVSNDGSATDFYNVPIGSVVGQKVIASSGLPLAGATIGLFNAAETNLIKEKAIATVLSENDGSFTFSNLLYGTYKIAEVAAPGRYLVNTSAVFTVTVNQNKQSITTDDSGNAILIANTRRSGGGGGGGGGNPGGGSDEGYIVIQKSSEDGVLSGFTFEITDGNAYTERFVTDADGRIMTGELPKGTYTVREIAEEGVTDRYELPKAQTVRISGVGTKLNFENKLLPEFIPPDEVPLGGGGGTEPSSPVEEIPDNDVPKGTVETFGPKTGYTGASPLWALMLGLSLAGLGYSVISLLVSRKKGRHVDK